VPDPARSDELLISSRAKLLKGAITALLPTLKFLLFFTRKKENRFISKQPKENASQKDSEFSGSGVIVGKRGKNELLILTDNHVVGGDRGAKLKDVTLVRQMASSMRVES